MMRNAARLALVVALVPACASSPSGSDIEDAENASVGGKSDSFAEGSAAARAILALVNDGATDVERLDVEAGLSLRAAENIIAGRGTGYATIAALDAVPYVGPATLTALFEFAKANGYLVEDDAELAIVWSLQTHAGARAACPTGYDTVALHSQPVNAAGQPTGAPIVDLYNCADGEGSAALPPGRYRVTLDVASHDGLMTYASSTSAVVDLTTNDSTVSFSILTDGGYFALAWVLEGATSGQALQCSDVPGQDGVSLESTVASTTQLFSDLWNCEDGSGTTGGLPAGTYTLSSSLFNASQEALGVSAPLTNRTIEPRNKVTDLGTVTIPVDGR